jgi:septin 3/9/12
MRGRKTRWGFIDVDDPKHTEFSLLRDVLVRTHTLDLKESTDMVHYELYREKHVVM